MSIRSDFAILDVLGRRDTRALERRVNTETVEVIIRAKIERPWGKWDGTSQEFTLEVLEIREVPQLTAAPKEQETK